MFHSRRHVSQLMSARSRMNWWNSSTVTTFVDMANGRPMITQCCGLAKDTAPLSAGADLFESTRGQHRHGGTRRAVADFRAGLELPGVMPPPAPVPARGGRKTRRQRRTATPQRPPLSRGRSHRVLSRGRPHRFLWRGRPHRVPSGRAARVPRTLPRIADRRRAIASVGCRPCTRAEY